jgi:uncharacterized protein YciI
MADEQSGFSMRVPECGIRETLSEGGGSEMEYLVIAHDGTDAGAKERRLKARQAHLEGAKALKANGQFINGGAILGEDGEMIGSSLYVEFTSREELDEWLANDPYTTGGVWVATKVYPVRLVFRE